MDCENCDKNFKDQYLTKMADLCTKNENMLAFGIIFTENIVMYGRGLRDMREMLCAINKAGEDKEELKEIAEELKKICIQTFLSALDSIQIPYHCEDFVSME